MENQIHFVSSSNCSMFTPNKFKKDLCQICNGKINKHYTATDQQIRDALNYMVDKVPSLIWSGRGNVFMGGYKSAINIKFIQDNSIHLILNASGNFENIMGPKYLSELKRRRLDCTTKEIKIDWIDAKNQKIEPNELTYYIREINTSINEGQSVLIHCAQGKSRSSVIAVVWILMNEEANTLKGALKILKLRRPIAEPNPGFYEQLREMEKNGSFKRAKNEIIINKCKE